jgi:Zn-dependent protease with chaperone function
MSFEALVDTILIIALLLLPAAVLALSFLIENRIRRRASRRGATVQPWLLLLLLLLLSTATFMGVVEAAAAIADGRQTHQVLISVVLLIGGLFHLATAYRALSLLFLVGYLRAGQTPARRLVREASLRYLGMLCLMMVSFLLLAEASRLVPLLDATPLRRYTAAMLATTLLFGALTPWMFALLGRCRPVKDRELRVMLRDLCRRAGVREPRTRIIDFAGAEVTNAWVTGLAFPGHTLFLSRRLLEVLNRNELSAILCHELGHVRYRHLPLCLAAGMLCLGLGSGVGALLFPATSPAAVACSLAVFLVSSAVCLPFVSRRCETAADRFAVTLVGESASLASALSKMGAGIASAKWARWFATHPCLADRCRLIGAGLPVEASG